MIIAQKKLSKKLKFLELFKSEDDYAIEFAEFLRKKCLIDDNYLYWWYYGIKYTEIELLEIFKKEKGL